MTKLVFIKKDKKAFLNILGGPITFYQKRRTCPPKRGRMVTLPIHKALEIYCDAETDGLHIKVKIRRQHHTRRGFLSMIG